MAPPHLGRESASTLFSMWRTRHHGGAVAATPNICLARARACAHARPHERKTLSSLLPEKTTALSGLLPKKTQGGQANARTPKKEIDVQQSWWFDACAHEAGHFERQGKQDCFEKGRWDIKPPAVSSLTGGTMHPLSSVPKPGPTGPGAELLAVLDPLARRASLLDGLYDFHSLRSHDRRLSEARRAFHRSQAAIVKTKLSQVQVALEARARGRVRVWTWQQFCASFRAPL